MTTSINITLSTTITVPEDDDAVWDISDEAIDEAFAAHVDKLIADAGGTTELLLAALTVDDWMPVDEEGGIFLFSPEEEDAADAPTSCKHGVGWDKECFICDDVSEAEAGKCIHGIPLAANPCSGCDKLALELYPDKQAAPPDTTINGVQIVRQR